MKLLYKFWIWKFEKSSKKKNVRKIKEKKKFWQPAVLPGRDCGKVTTDNLSVSASQSAQFYRK